MIMDIVLAVTTSIAVFALLVVFSLDCVSGQAGEERVFENIVAALGLLVGLHWEIAFELALHSTLLQTGRRFDGTELMEYACCVALVDLLVVPAWMYFVLPRAVTGLKRDAGQQRLFSQDLYEDSSDAHSGPSSEAEVDMGKEGFEAEADARNGGRSRSVSVATTTSASTNDWVG